MYLHSGNVIHRDQKVFMISSILLNMPVLEGVLIFFFPDQILRLNVFVGSCILSIKTCWHFQRIYLKWKRRMKWNTYFIIRSDYHWFVDLNQNFPPDLLYVLVISQPNVVLAHGKLDIMNYVYINKWILCFLTQPSNVLLDSECFVKVSNTMLPMSLSVNFFF